MDELGTVLAVSRNASEWADTLDLLSAQYGYRVLDVRTPATPMRRSPTSMSISPLPKMTAAATGSTFSPACWPAESSAPESSSPGRDRPDLATSCASKARFRRLFPRGRGRIEASR